MVQGRPSKIAGDRFGWLRMPRWAPPDASSVARNSLARVSYLTFDARRQRYEEVTIVGR